MSNNEPRTHVDHCFACDAHCGNYICDACRANADVTRVITLGVWSDSRDVSVIAEFLFVAERTYDGGQTYDLLMFDPVNNVEALMRVEKKE